MTESTSGWALLPLPGAVTTASYLTGSLAKQYRLIVDILDDQRGATLTGVGFDELASLIRGHLPDEHARELLDELALDSRMRQLVEWGTCTSWQDRAESQEDFLRNRYRYQLTEAGSQINAAARAIDAELGTTSTAVLLAPAAIVDRLRGTLEALRVDDPVAAANEFSQVRHTLDAMSAAASEWQTRLAAALGGSPTEANVTRLLETILAYADAWGSGVDAWTDTIAGLLPRITEIDDAHWHAMALVRLGSKATKDALAGTVAEMRGDLDRLGLWFTAPTLQAARLRRQIRNAVTPVLRSHRALLAVGGTVSRKADLLRLAEAIEAAPTDDDAWQIWCTATGLYSARHVALRVGLRPPEADAALPGGVDTGLDPLTDERALVLGERGQDLQHQPAGRRLGVDAVCDGHELDASLGQVVDGGHHVDHGPADPIEPPDDQLVLLAELGVEFGPARACPRLLRARDLVGVDVLRIDTGGDQRPTLQVVSLLVPGRGAGVSELHY